MRGEIKGVVSYETILSRPNLCLVYFLMSSYLYYVLGTSVLTDTEFDEMCMVLKERWEEVDHPQKYLVTPEMLNAGTGFSINYPTITRHAAVIWWKENGGKR